MNFGNYADFNKFKDYYYDCLKQSVHRENQNINTLDCLGNYLINAKQSYQCFDAFE